MHLSGLEKTDFSEITMLRNFVFSFRIFELTHQRTG